MLIFKKFGLSDIKTIRSYFSVPELIKTRACENTIGGIFIWRDFFSIEYAEHKQNFIFKGKLNNIEAFFMPLGKTMREIKDSFKEVHI